MDRRGAPGFILNYTQANKITGFFLAHELIFNKIIEINKRMITCTKLLAKVFATFFLG